MWKPASLQEDRPLYLAIADALAHDVAAGRLAPGERLPPQREMARIIGVDLSTVTRALAECTRRGLVSGTVGRGTFVAADIGAVVPLYRSGDAPGLLEMGLVLPLYATEADARRAIRKTLLSLDLDRYLRYADPAGMPEHREAGARWVSRAGIKASAGELLVTSGSQNALACCLMALFAPGDRIAVDSLTFPGLKTLARMMNVRLVPIAMDDSGMIPESLDAACRREPIRGIYLMPEFQNPTTLSLPEERRERIARLVERRDLILMEDDAYGHTGKRRAAISSRLRDHGIYIGGTSKVFGAGLRISFVVSPKRFLGPLEQAILSTVWMASPLNAALVSSVITSGEVESIIRAKNEESRRRTALTLRKLAPWPVRARPAGFFIWLELPAGWTGREFELAAREMGVRLFGAEKFAVGGIAAPPAARVSLTGPETYSELSKGLDVLAGILSAGPRAPDAIL
jgi:DNA-binding transcriptional MocR family regulator